MAKHPYLKFFVGDWLRDTRVLSSSARGVWIDLLCYMHLQIPRGVITDDITGVSRLAGENIKDTQKILKELEKKGIAEVQFFDDGIIEIKSRRMIRDEAESAVKSDAGITGMEKRYNKKYRPVNDTVITERQQTVDYGNDYGNGSEGEKGGAGEKEDWQKPNKPEKQAVHEFFMRAGSNTEEADKFFNYYEGLGWKKGISPIMNWASFANNWIASNNSENGRNTGKNGKRIGRGGFEQALPGRTTNLHD
jgi:uncharacterized protein YdaU (DUF1376 family)